MKSYLEAFTASMEASTEAIEAVKASSMEAFMEDMEASTQKKNRKLPRKLPWK